MLTWLLLIVLLVCCTGCLPFHAPTCACVERMDHTFLEHSVQSTVGYSLYTVHQCGQYRITHLESMLENAFQSGFFSDCLKGMQAHSYTASSLQLVLICMENPAGQLKNQVNFKPALDCLLYINRCVWMLLQ